MNKLFIVYAKCLHPEQRIIEIKEDDLKIYLCELMDYSIENKPEILEFMSLTEARKLMYKNAIGTIEWTEILECGTYAIVNLEDVREIDLNVIPFMFDLDDLLDCEEVNDLLNL